MDGAVDIRNTVCESSDELDGSVREALLPDEEPSHEFPMLQHGRQSVWGGIEARVSREHQLKYLVNFQLLGCRSDHSEIYDQD